MAGKVVLSLVAMLFAFALVACGGPTRYVVQGTDLSRGTDGKITLEEIEGDNLMVVVEFTNLPPPDRIANGMTAYVVWFQPPNGQPTKAGNLAYDADERTGSMRATSAHERMTVLVTAERNTNVAAPSESVIARQNVRNGD